MTMSPSKSLESVTTIGISGKQFAGKDVLADALLQLLGARGLEFQKVPLALAIKEEYGQQNGVSLSEIEENKAQHRPGLIALGNWGRAQDPDYWLKKVLKIPGRKLISDVRLKREYELLRAEGAFLIRLEADRANRGARGNLVSEDDATETQLDDVKDWDCVIVNNSTPGMFQSQIEAFVASFG